MMMRKCCSLDLHLSPSPSSSLMADCATIPNQQASQPGRNCVFDLTKLQARAIIWKASEEIMKETVKRDCKDKVMYYPAAGSLKRSLQRFLQKRKKRLQATSPYNSN